MHLPSSLLPALAATVSATGLILPLYVYPAASWQDGAAKWKPVIDAASSNPSVPWLTVVNPNSGPGDTLLPGNNDPNYVAGVSKLNALRNIKTIGYVRTNYAKHPMDDLKRQMTAYKGWNDYTAANISIHGIFFDESAQDLTYMREAVRFAKSSFGGHSTIVCNFGAAAAADYYELCDVVVPFESCLNCAGKPQYKSGATIDANVPAGKLGKAAVIINYFEGTAFDGSVADAALVKTYLATAKQKGLAWVYFASKDYDDVVSGPATIGEVARGLASGSGSGSGSGSSGCSVK
jgi:hypothetical protein